MTGKYWGTFKGNIRQRVRKVDDIKQRLADTLKALEVAEQDERNELKTDTHLLTDKARIAFANLIRKAKHVSDPIDMYEPNGTCSRGFDKWLCLRGTNKTETANLVFDSFLAGSSNGPELGYAVMLLGATFYNTDRRRGAGREHDFIHYDMDLARNTRDLATGIISPVPYADMSFCARLSGPVIDDERAAFGTGAKLPLCAGTKRKLEDTAMLCGAARAALKARTSEP